MVLHPWAALGEGVGLLQHDPHLHEAERADPGLQRARDPTRHEPVDGAVLQSYTQGEVLVRDVDSRR